LHSEIVESTAGMISLEITPCCTLEHLRPVKLVRMTFRHVQTGELHVSRPAAASSVRRIATTHNLTADQINRHWLMPARSITEEEASDVAD
jgi:hypothetical protein